MEKKRNHRKPKNPFFGKKAKLTGSVDSLDGKWHVDFFEVRYYFFGVEFFSITKEVVVPDKTSN